MGSTPGGAPRLRGICLLKPGSKGILSTLWETFRGAVSGASGFGAGFAFGE